MKQTNNKKSIIIIAIFMIPLAAAISWYKLLPEDFQPAQTTNNGDLLDPIFTLTPFSNLLLQGGDFSNVEVEKVWTMVHLIEGECDEKCSQALYKTRQIRIALGKEIDRVNRIAVLNSDGTNESNRKMWGSHSDLFVLLANEQGLGAQIKSRIEDIKLEQNSVLLIDPLGNVMMHFAPTLEPKLILKDIRKLLKLSQIG